MTPAHTLGPGRPLSIVTLLPGFLPSPPLPPVPTSAGNAQCKAALLRELGLPHDTSTHPGGRPLLAIVTRLTEQKGLPLLKHGVEAAIKNGAQVRAVTCSWFQWRPVYFVCE